MAVIRSDDIKLISVSEIKLNPKNPNKHSKEQIDRLSKIIKYQGFRDPLIISNRSGLLISGHGRIQAAKKLGMKEVPVLFQDFEDDVQEYAALVSENSIASWAELDLSSINTEVGDLGPDFDIDLLGIDGFEIEPVDKLPPGDPDEIPPEPKEVKTVLGDIYELGSHRLMCGDSTSVDAVEKLLQGQKIDMVYTDPPYGMNLNPDFSKVKFKCSTGVPNKKYEPIIGDDKEYDPGFILSYFEYVAEIFLWGADHYYWNLPKDGVFIVWDKRRSDNFEVKETVDNIFGSHFEICWSKNKHRREIIRHYRVMGAMEGGVEKRHIGGTMVHLHPTQKPVDLFEKIGGDIKGDHVLDLFGGSGSTLIACEKTNRKCFMSEIDPYYVQVIVERWMKYTGKMAYLIEDSSGKLEKPAPYADLHLFRGMNT